MSRPERDPRLEAGVAPPAPHGPAPASRGVAGSDPAGLSPEGVERTSAEAERGGEAGRAEDVERLLLAEERALVEVRRQTGRVRVRTAVEAVEEVARAELAEEDVEVERVAVNAYVDAPPAIRTEGDVTIVPVFEEVLVVETRLLLKEELRLRRVRKVETVEVPVTLRRTRAVVEEEAAESGDPAAPVASSSVPAPKG